MLRALKKSTYIISREVYFCVDFVGFSNFGRFIEISAFIKLEGIKPVYFNTSKM